MRRARRLVTEGHSAARNAAPGLVTESHKASGRAARSRQSRGFPDAPGRGAVSCNRQPQVCNREPQGRAWPGVCLAARSLAARCLAAEALAARSLVARSLAARALEAAARHAQPGGGT